MQRYHQELDAIVASLSAIETSWMDEHSAAVIQAIEALPEKPSYSSQDVGDLLDGDFKAALTTIQLILGMSKDEFGIALKDRLGEGGAGVTRFRRNRQQFITAVEELGFTNAISALVNKPVGWRDILVERLKYGRGSAIKGQRRGRSLEDFTEKIIQYVFDDIGYDRRCRFVGASGTSTEKADFAIPTKQHPRILIEVKAYGATGSKQTDILGDVSRIVEQKRHDTQFLLVTDGVTWRERLNDLRKLVDMQNQGLIARIYTQSMAADLKTDLGQLREDHCL